VEAHSILLGILFSILEIEYDVREDRMEGKWAAGIFCT
jgi:hypothetical protein